MDATSATNSNPSPSLLRVPTNAVDEQEMLTLLLTEEEEEEAIAEPQPTFNDDYETTGTTLGKGTFAEVVLALNRKTREKVAVKKFLVQPGNASKQHNSMQHEILIMQTLTHDHIIRFIGCYEESSFYLVMEYLGAV